MKLSIDVVDIMPKLKDEIETFTLKTVERMFNTLMKKYMEEKELPKYMNKKQACIYMNTSYNTLTKKYMRNGLRTIIIEGEEKLDQADCDAFYELHKKQDK